MPELPEIETIKQGLSKHILRQRIQRMSIHTPKLRYPINIKPKQLIGQQITAINRRSKYLIFELEQQQLLCHLGMSGRLWLVESDNTPRNRHDHVDIQLENCCLRYHDPRRFGALLMTTNVAQHKLLQQLGPEPLSRSFNTRYLQYVLSQRQTTIKQAIMNNQIVVGVGNIYANEALFRAGILPTTLCNSISQPLLQLLTKAIKQTLNTAIKAGGTTLKDFTDIKAKPGYFSQELLVYGRHGLPCIQCHNPIQSLRQQGRRSYYCQHCQK